MILSSYAWILLRLFLGLNLNADKFVNLKIILDNCEQCGHHFKMSISDNDQNSGQEGYGTWLWIQLLSSDLSKENAVCLCFLHFSVEDTVIKEFQLQIFSLFWCVCYGLYALRLSYFVILVYWISSSQRFCLAWGYKGNTNPPWKVMNGFHLVIWVTMLTYWFSGGGDPSKNCFFFISAFDGRGAVQNILNPDARSSTWIAPSPSRNLKLLICGAPLFWPMTWTKNLQNPFQNSVVGEGSPKSWLNVSVDNRSHDSN